MDCAPHAPKGGKVDKAHTQTNDDIAWNLLWVVFFLNIIFYIDYWIRFFSHFNKFSRNSQDITMAIFSLSLFAIFFLSLNKSKKKITLEIRYIYIYIHIRKEMLSITRVLCSCACLLHQQRETNEGAWRQPLQNQNNQIKLQN